IICPDPRSVTSYFEGQPELISIFSMIPKKHVISGVEKLRVDKEKNEVLAEIGVSNEKKLFGFFGRYHEHKGFDRFIKIVKYFSNDPHIQFICAGQGELTPPNLPNLKNLGWRKDIANIMNACDGVFVLNRYTY